MTQTPSSGTGATPPTGLPVTGTPAPGSVTPPAAALTLEEALKRIDDLEHSHKNATEEVERHRKSAKRLSELEKAESDRQAAQLSEQERQAKEVADLQEANEDLAAALMEVNVHQDIARFAKKFNFILDDPELIAGLLNWKDIEWDEETGNPLNIEKLLEKLAKAQPKLTEQAPTQPQMRQAPATPAWNPGRSSVSPPGGNIPGRIPRLEDIEWKR